MAGRGLGADQRGLSTVEYIILFVLVAIIGIVTWQLFGGALEENVTDARDEIAQVGVGGTGRGTGMTKQVAGARSAEEGGSEAGTMAGGPNMADGMNMNAAGTASMGTGAAGVVSRPSAGGPSVYTVAPEEESSAGKMWFLVAILVFLFLGGFVFYSKAKRGNTGA